MSAQSTSHPRLILCVDDELVGLNVRRLLLERAGYNVLTALSGPQGLLLFEREPVDAVVLDYFMPGMHGAAVAAAMRQSKAAVPILLLSAHLVLPEAVNSLDDVYCTKGEGTSAFLKTLDSLLETA
jgi:CheY-like chemotaxis protein